MLVHHNISLNYNNNSGVEGFQLKKLCVASSYPPKGPRFDTLESWVDRDAGTGCSVLGPIPLTSSGWPKLNLKVQYNTDNDLDAARAPLSYS